MSKYVIYSVASSIESQPYLKKLANLLDERGEVLLKSWSRNNDERLASKFKTKILFKAGKMNSPLLPFLYPIWMLIVFFNILLTKKNDSVIFASKFETGFPIACASLLQNIKFIYLDRDNIALSYNWPKWLESLLILLENFISKRSYSHIVPGHTRVMTNSKKIKIIENTPDTSILKNSASLAPLFIKKKDKFYIYINGWLTEQRGINFIISTIQELKHDNRFIFIFAGNGSEYIMKKILSLGNNVHYLGKLSPEIAFSVYKDIDCVLSFYDPNLRIHQYAEPNKWYDCLFTNTKIIINKDIEASINFIEKFGFNGINYSDSAQLKKMLNKLYKKRGEDIRYIHDYKPWEVKMNAIIDSIC